MGMGSIYPLLYDIFNRIFTKEGNRKYCKVSLGEYCNDIRPINSRFKCILFLENDECIIDSNDPYFGSRFKRHYINLDQILTDSSKEIVKEIDQWVDSLVTLSDCKGKFDSNIVFPIYSKECSPYLVLRHAVKSADHIMERCKRSLIKASSVDLLFLLYVIDICTEDKEEIKKQWEDTHRETFLQMVSKPTHQTIKLIALTYDSFSVQSLIVSLNAIHFQILTKMTSAEDLKSDISRFYFSEDQIYIIEIDYDKDDKHLLLLISEINSIDENNTALDKKKKFILLIRMNRNDKCRPPLKFNIKWDIRMFENLRTNSYEILEIQEKELLDLIFENRLYTFEENITELIENAFLNLKYDVDSDSSDFVKYKIEISRKIIENNIIVENLKQKTFELIRSNFDQNLYTESWKVALFTDGDTNLEAINLEHAVMLRIKKEIQANLSSIIFLIEDKNALNSYVISINSREMYDYWESSYRKLNFEGMKMINAISENLLHFAGVLNTPFIFGTFTQIKEFYIEALLEAARRKEELETEHEEEKREVKYKREDEIEEAVNREDPNSPLFIFIKIVSEKLDKETISYFENPTFGESIITDFLKILYENSRDENLYDIMLPYIEPCKTILECIFTLFDFVEGVREIRSCELL